MASAQASVWQRFAMRFFALTAIAFLAWSGFAQAQLVPEAAGEAIQGILGEGEGLSGTVIQLFLFVTILSLVPGIAMMVTCLPFMVIVFSILRQALGVQQAPPNMMIMSLAMFLTFFIMEPVFMEAWVNGLSPYIDGTLSEQEAWTLTTEPFREFMMRRTDPEALLVLSDALNRPVGPDEEYQFSLLATSFMLSEIKHAFQIGFVIFMPFMVIDLVVASVLMAVGMMMVPPTVVSLPFKLGFFVLADGWLKITEALLRGYA
ncbi:MAG: flagellar type III secretion system pore protein FliP [Henriciella sp.]